MDCGGEDFVIVGYGIVFVDDWLDKLMLKMYVGSMFNKFFEDMIWVFE